MCEEYENLQTIAKNTDKLLQESEFLDYTVNVDNDEFRCHRVILAASSHFFRALLRSNMKEEKEGCVTLSGMSAPTFQIILKSLYTGKVVLTLDNFIEVWQAADQLQVDFIAKNCEDFAVKVISLENCEVIFKTAKTFNSKQVLNLCKTFLLNNFDDVSGMETLMEMGINEFNELISSHALKVSSEDKVLETVMKWVEYVPKESLPKDNNEDRSGLNVLDNNTTKDERLETVNEFHDISVEHEQTNEAKGKRIENLPTLLKSVRTCLVSNQLLKHVLKHPLILDNTEARDILIDAVLYKTTHYNHGQWLTSGIHRASSEFEHCGIVCVNKNIFYILSACAEEIHTCVKNTFVNADVTFVVFDSDLYVAGASDPSQTNSTLYVLSDNSWQKITELNGRQLILVPFEERIFILDKFNPVVYTITKKKWNANVAEFTKLPDVLNVKHAINYQKMILIFISVMTNEEEKTEVYQLNILTKELTELEQLNGPAEQIISFSDDNNTFVLQTNGNLWKINVDSSDTIYFEFVEKLWNIQRKLYGALTYKQKLIIFGQRPKCEPPEQKRLGHLEGYFNKIKYWGHDSACSNFVPVALPKSELLPTLKKL
ncbi:kelch-like protein 31 [Physella acuta]|uniref:kelch-like protein 31 n=1 Tax=Physella acuta TaxID=109671 RepID=UPI0027DCFDF3|nr:kelch-like protein 31 [Physella acuta]